LNYRDIAENVVSKSNNVLNRKAPLTQNDIQAITRNYAEFKRISAMLNSKRNTRSMVGEQIRRTTDEGDISGKESAVAEGKLLKDEISRLEVSLEQIEQELLDLALVVPNDTHPLAPLGPPSAAVILSTHGPEPIAPTSARDHLTVGRQLGLIDLESSAAVTGTSWCYLTNEGALLEMALTSYALSVATRRGFKPVATPDVVKLDIAQRCGFQPRDHSDPPMSQIYRLEGPASSPSLALSATAEIPLAGMSANTIFPLSGLPLKLVGVGRAFRAEAGARGADTRGLYRVHQFTKVELFAVTSGDKSDEMMDEMSAIQVEIMQGLGVPFKYVRDYVFVRLSSLNILECWICPLRNLEPVRIENLILRRGCQDVATGEKYLPYRTAQTINPDGYSSDTRSQHHQIPPLRLFPLTLTTMPIP
jgi:seryl-tRNA synthetase